MKSIYSTSSKTYRASFYSLPSILKDWVRISRLMFIIAGAVAIMGVVYALSNDSISTANRFFVEPDGYALMGVRERNYTSEDVERAFTPPVQGEIVQKNKQ